MRLLFSKVSGPKMTLSETEAYLPGTKQIGVEIDAPSAAGDYSFSILAQVSGCGLESCKKTVSGTFHVPAETAGGFDVYLSPKNMNIMGTRTVMYTLGIRNYGSADRFSIVVDTGSLETSFQPFSLDVAKDTERSVEFDVTPSSGESRIYTVKAIVRSSAGVGMSEAYLTVNELREDAERLAEYVPEAKEELDTFSGDFTFDDWQEFRENTDAAVIRDDAAFQQPDATIPAVIAVVVIIGLLAGIGFYLYRRMNLMSEDDELGIVQP
jgi:hypothetical protein